jgi:hypothetical protein
MDWLYELRPIRFFSLYLALMFLLSTWLRVTQYRAVLSLAVGFKNRWPNLTKLVLTHRHIFLTRGIVAPLAVLLALLVVNTVASQLIWPQADRFRLAELIAIWPALILALLTGAAMAAFDTWGVLAVGPLDRAETEKYFDQAEKWLTGWRAPAVSVLSLGYVSPRSIVDREVRASLESAAAWLTTTFRWVSLQAGLRITFGMVLWGSWALEGWLRSLLGL